LPGEGSAAGDLARVFGAGEADKLARGKSAIFPSACIFHARRVAKEGDSHLGNSNVLR
jgi:hypothetical protein